MDPDLDLVRGLQGGDMPSLREAYERHGERVQRLCRRLLGRAPDAEDATQDVFLKLFERARSFDGRARFATWLHRLTVNLCLHRLERDRLRQAAQLPEHDGALVDRGEAPDSACARGEAEQFLERLLARLSSEHRAVIVLRELEQLSYREIAAALAIPEGTVMSRLARARDELLKLSQLESGDSADCASREAQRSYRRHAVRNPLV
jgi:RNA polymerase sigma-70 factor (ECF subfamily)